MAEKDGAATVSPLKEKELKSEESKDVKSDKKDSSKKPKTSLGEVPSIGLDKKNSQRNLNLVLDLPLKVTAELGRTRIAVRDLLNMGQGSVIELNKLAGEPMEIFVNDKLVAKGEAVVVNEKFGVRLIDIISPIQRVEQLK